MISFLHNDRYTQSSAAPADFVYQDDGRRMKHIGSVHDTGFSSKKKLEMLKADKFFMAGTGRPSQYYALQNYGMSPVQV